MNGTLEANSYVGSHFPMYITAIQRDAQEPPVQQAGMAALCNTITDHVLKHTHTHVSYPCCNGARQGTVALSPCRASMSSYLAPCLRARYE